MRTLKDLQEEYGYAILTNDEVRAVREHTLSWESLEGEIIIRKCMKSYPAYLQVVNYGYMITPFHYSMAANLQREFERGPNPKPGLEKLVDRTQPYDPSKPDYNRMPYGLILLSAPPQVGKSLTITESFQSWILTKFPRLGILTLGYASDFASRFGRRNRDKFEEFAIKLTHGRVKLHDKVQSTGEWETMVLDRNSRLYVTSNGGMSSAGLRGVVTGKTGNVVVIDDPIKNMQDAMSEIMVEGNIEAYQSTVETRLLGNPGSLCIVMATRWVTNDLLGWLRKHRKDFIVGDYNYAALATEANVLKDPLRRVPGEGVCPEMGKDDSWATVIKASYEASEGAHVYGALFQGDPSNEKGNLFKADDWQEYEIDKHWPVAEEINGEIVNSDDRIEKLRKFDRIFLSIDATFKNLDTSDFVAMGVMGIKQGNAYLRYLVRKQLDFPDTIDKLLYILKKFPEIETIYIEDKANGSGIVSVIKKWRKKLGIPEKDFPSVVPVEPEGSKYSRANAAAAYQRDGRCYIPCERDAHLLSTPDDFVWEEDGLSYAHCYKQELGTFPFAGNDDLVDMFSQGIKKSVGLLTGVEKTGKKVERFSRYSQWWPEMEADYNSLKTRTEKRDFIRLHGANMKWKPKDEGGEYGSM
jgi:hypothetical protein